ncbi:MAG: glycosyltransferase, partial [Clostridia bacterium]|nr:glycosyltransferase [Clostridia bacterium]
LKLSNFKGLSDLKKIINNNHYDLVWTNEPVMGVMTRLASKKARKNGTKVLYMAHGFHFYKGAPKLNWLVYYPIEKMMAKHTDLIVTVNKEDFVRAQKFKVKDVKYIHGIGINTARLQCNSDSNGLRDELNIDKNAIILLSVGELNDNKNQETALRAFAKVKNNSVHYVLCGKGKRIDYLKSLAKRLGVEQRTHFLGYRKDVVDICFQSNIYIMPSKREGLPVASLEAMYCGLPLITSNIRGLVDIMENDVSGFMHPCYDVDGFSNSIELLSNDAELCKRMGLRNQEEVKPYCLDRTKMEILTLIEETLRML